MNKQSITVKELRKALKKCRNQDALVLMEMPQGDLTSGELYDVESIHESQVMAQVYIKPAPWGVE